MQMVGTLGEGTRSTTRFSENAERGVVFCVADGSASREQFESRALTACRAPPRRCRQQAKTTDRIVPVDALFVGLPSRAPLILHKLSSIFMQKLAPAGLSRMTALHVQGLQLRHRRHRPIGRGEQIEQEGIG